MKSPWPRSGLPTPDTAGEEQGVKHDGRAVPGAPGAEAKSDSDSQHEELTQWPPFQPTGKIQEHMSQQLGVAPGSVKTCWIAEVKRELGLTGRSAHNAGRGRGAPPCPPRYRDAIRRFISPAQSIS